VPEPVWESQEAGPIPVCLTIGSSDSSGGAGIQGDIKAYASVGCYAATVIVGLTAQNTGGVTGRWSVPVPFVLQQLETVLAELPCAAVKLGSTWSADLLAALGPPLARLAADGVPVVVDPVMVTAAGSRLADPEQTRDALFEHIFPAARVVTPNRQETELLLGASCGPAAPRRELAEALVRAGAPAVLVTGGPGEAGDWYFDGKRHEHLDGARHATGAEHGVGCAHSTILAGLLAHGYGLLEAAVEAHRRAGAAVLGGHTDIGARLHPVDALGLGKHAEQVRLRVAAGE
jgi:hydroxymethylpyrimidine/phosphomethylpyrimidine kinase